MEVEYNLESMQINLNIKYLNNLIIACNKINLNSDNIKNKLLTLNNELSENIDNYTISEKNEETEKTITENSKMNYLYLKSWSKLNQIHKVIKIKEFINELEINNYSEKEKLKDDLIDQIKNKEKKNKIKINYDDTKGKIISISNLSFDNNKYILL